MVIGPRGNGTWLTDESCFQGSEIPLHLVHLIRRESDISDSPSRDVEATQPPLEISFVLISYRVLNRTCHLIGNSARKDCFECFVC